MEVRRRGITRKNLGGSVIFARDWYWLGGRELGEDGLDVLVLIERDGACDEVLRDAVTNKVVETQVDVAGCVALLDCRLDLLVLGLRGCVVTRDQVVGVDFEDHGGLGVHDHEEHARVVVGLLQAELGE